MQEALWFLLHFTLAQRDECGTQVRCVLFCTPHTAAVMLVGPGILHLSHHQAMVVAPLGRSAVRILGVSSLDGDDPFSSPSTTPFWPEMLILSLETGMQAGL